MHCQVQSLNPIKQRTKLGAVATVTVLPHTRHQMTLLSFCRALFALTMPCLVLKNPQLKLYWTRFSYSSISPLSIKANL